MFIPSTLAGSCIDTGEVNKQKLEENMNLAIDAYISQVDGCPCGETQIQLFRGADSSELQSVREKLHVLLKGSNKSKEAVVYAHFELIWAVRSNHMVSGLQSYMFFLSCCYKTDCPRPLCQAGPPQTALTWYPGGPRLTELPLPFPDPARPWGASCTTCKGFCSGHMLRTTTLFLKCQSHLP